MGNRIKIPNPDFPKFSDAMGKAAKAVVTFVQAHKEKLLGAGLLLAIIDNCRLRRARKKDQKAFEECSVKQQEVARKHEAEINALRAEAEQAREANRRIDQLEHIVKKITEEGGSE